MKLLPSESYTIYTSCTKKEVISVVSQMLNINFAQTGNFIGKVHELGFTVYRETWYANAMMPIISGHLISADQRVRIDIKISIDNLTKVFLIGWYAIAALLPIGSVITWITIGELDWGFLYGPIMFVWMYVVSIFWWSLEVGKARRFLKRLNLGLKKQSV